MVKPNFKSMAKKELGGYVVDHPNDQDAFDAFVDRFAISSQEISDEISTNLREAQRNKKFHHLLTEVSNWATRRSEIKAAALVGSWASHPAQMDAGIDVMFLTVSPSLFRQDHNWMNEISWSIVDTKIQNWQDQDRGMVWSRHISLEDGTKVKFSFGFPFWASIDIVDFGTAQVINSGCQILYDPENLLSQLINKLNLS
jgi:Streptomycin adenylyltransferase